MKVEIPQLTRDRAAQLGAGVPYALKVLASQLAEHPDMGEPSQVPGVLSVKIDGDLFEDCPDIRVGYSREHDRIEIRYLQEVASSQPDPHESSAQQGEHPTVDSVADALTVREVAGAWGRIISWLRDHAPDSYEALRTGASLTDIAALEEDLGLRIPASLRTLWLLSAGDDGVIAEAGWGCLPDNQALITLDIVAPFYRERLALQAELDTRHAEDPEEDRVIAWKPEWIPFISFGAGDRTSGLYLDAITGYLGRWSRHNEAFDGELDTLVTYLEETADALETPHLARQKAGLIGGALVWESARLNPDLAAAWRPS